MGWSLLIYGGYSSRYVIHNLSSSTGHHPIKSISFELPDPLFLYLVYTYLPIMAWLRIGWQNSPTWNPADSVVHRACLAIACWLQPIYSSHYLWPMELIYQYCECSLKLGCGPFKQTFQHHHICITNDFQLQHPWIIPAAMGSPIRSTCTCNFQQQVLERVVYTTCDSSALQSQTLPARLSTWARPARLK